MKNAFVDPVTNVLVSWGSVNQNRPGDIVVPVDNDFHLEPHQWQWTGVDANFVPFVPSPPARPLHTQLAAVNTTPALTTLLTSIVNLLES